MTRRLMVRAAIEMIRRRGLAALSMRSVSDRIGLKLSSVQFHFGSQDQFVQQMIAHWGQCVSAELLAAGRDSLGLVRLWRLCRYWAESRDAEIVTSELDIECPTTVIRRGAMQTVVKEWIGETTKALRQARVLDELRSGVSVAEVAFDLHALVWSRSWACAVYGESAARRALLERVRERIAALAREPHVFLAEAADIDAPRPLPDFEPHAFERPAAWRDYYERTDPQFYAYARVELMGERPSIAVPPEVTADDIAQANEYRERNLRRSAVAVAPDRPEVAAPHRSSTATGPDAEAESPDERLVLHDQPTTSWFSVLTPADALFHAFVRVESEGDERTMLDPPAITAADEAKAEQFADLRFAEALHRELASS